MSRVYNLRNNLGVLFTFFRKGVVKEVGRFFSLFVNKFHGLEYGHRETCVKRILGVLLIPFNKIVRGKTYTRYPSLLNCTCSSVRPFPVTDVSLALRKLSQVGNL